jgi:hypothetical protein
MTRNATVRLLNVTCDTPSCSVAHGPAMRVTRQYPTPQRGRGNGVVRAHALARHQHPGTGLAAEATPLAILGGLTLWLLRLALAPVSTLAGFRVWVLEECPVAPGRRAARPASPLTRAQPGRGTTAQPPKATKTGRFLSLVTERHGLLASIPLDRVASISAALAPQADLNTGAARAALRSAILAAQNGTSR